MRAVALLLVAGCYDPPQPVCGFLCGAGGACPSGYTCNEADGYCHLAGTSQSCPLIDAGTDAFDFFPVIIETSPAHEATGVRLDTILTARFTEPVVGVSATSFTVVPIGDFTPLGAAVTYNAQTRTATLIPDGPLAPSTMYIATLGAEIVDAVGHHLVAPTSWAFTTMEDVVPPQLVSLSPPDGATGVPVDVVLVATFDEQVMQVTPGSFLLSLPPAPPPDRSASSR